jgi:RNase H-fold protein (predicted Holliday junction resolvase)
MTKFQNTPKVLGLDVSTKTIGIALFDIPSQQLLELGKKYIVNIQTCSKKYGWGSVQSLEFVMPV